MRTMMMTLGFVLLATAALPASARTKAATQSAKESSVETALPAQAEAAPAEEIRCPVTGDAVKDPSKAQKSVYKGKTYYFCCPACKPKFDADPEKYVGKGK